MWATIIKNGKLPLSPGRASFWVSYHGPIRGEGLIFGDTYVWTTSSVSYKSGLSDRDLSAGGLSAEFKSPSGNFANVHKDCLLLIAILKRVDALMHCLCQKKVKWEVKKPSNELIENTKMKIGKSEINLNTFQFSVWILVLYKLLNFDF